MTLPVSQKLAIDIRVLLSIMSLLDCPNELLLLIAKSVHSPKDINSLLRINRRLAALLTPVLHGCALQLENTKRGSTPLQWAAKRGYEGLVRLLLNHGVDINYGYPESALYQAVYFGKISTVKLLLERGAIINKYTREWTEGPLHLVAEGGDEALAKLLLQHGADPSVRAGRGQTPLHLAALYGHEGVVRQLVEMGADVDAVDDGGHIPIEILGCRVELDRWGLPPAGYNHKAIIKLLWKGVPYRRDPEVKVTTSDLKPALHHAVECGDGIRVKILLDQGVNINAKDWGCNTALHVAISNGDEEMVRLLVGNGANISTAKNSNDMAALHQAVRFKRTTIVEYLLEKGANIEALGFQRKTPLFYAVDEADAAMVKLLLRKGANITAKLRGKATVLHAAAFLGYAELVRILLVYGADLHAVDMHGYTAKAWFKEFSDLRNDRHAEAYRSMDRLLGYDVCQRKLLQLKSIFPSSDSQMFVSIVVVLFAILVCFLVYGETKVMCSPPCI